MAWRGTQFAGRLISVLVWSAGAGGALPQIVYAGESGVLNTCLAAADAPVAVSGPDDEGIFYDKGGRQYVLAEIYSDSPEFPAAAWARKPQGQLIAYPLGPANRWNLIPAFVVLQSAEEMRLLQQDSLESGAAIYMPKRSSGPCSIGLRRSETLAQRHARGIWGAGVVSPVQAAAHPESLLKAVGRYTIVRGRIVSLGKTRSSRYLNFGRYWKTDFTVTLATADEEDALAGLRRDGWSFEELAGRAVEIRGVVEVRDGPLIAWYHPEQLIVLEEKRAGRDSQKQN